MVSVGAPNVAISSILLIGVLNVKRSKRPVSLRTAA